MLGTTVPSVENPELTNILPLKPGVGQNTDTHASPVARIFFFFFFFLVLSRVLILTFPVHLSYFVPDLLPAF